jgi:hypothetical protein
MEFLMMFTKFNPRQNVVVNKNAKGILNVEDIQFGIDLLSLCAHRHSSTPKILLLNNATLEGE